MPSGTECVTCSRCGHTGPRESDGHLPIGWKILDRDDPAIVVCPMCWGPITEQLPAPEDNDATTPAWWQKHGYLAGKPIGNGMWVCIVEMIFTYRAMVCDEQWVGEFWCYSPDRLGDLLGAFEEWDGTGPPLPNWTRHHAP